MNEYINKIKERNPMAKFYSHSKLNNFNQCKRSYYYTYIDKKEQKPSVYSTLGTACHTSLERLYEGVDDTLDKSIFDNEFDKCELFGINFPKSKYDIKGGYKKDINAFYDIYKKIQGDNFISELGFVLKVDNDHYIMGYIDLIRLNKDGTADIYDFKTSSDFGNGDHLISASRQLILYKLAIEQLYDIHVKTVSWQMLKYVNVKVDNNTEKISIKGREWVSKCSSQIKKLMKQKGYDVGLIEMYLNKAISENSIECLPANIKSEITVNTYTRYFNVTDEAIEEFWDYYKNTIKDIESMDNNIDSWECKYDVFFCENLCGFNPKYCSR